MKRKSIVCAGILLLSVTLGSCSLLPRINQPASTEDKLTGGMEKTTEEVTKPFQNTEAPYSNSNTGVDDKLDQINKLIDSNFYFETDDEKREEYVYKGLVWSLDDPYSTYYTAEEFQEMVSDSSGSYEGIGVSIQQNPETYALTIIRVFRGSGADKVGVQPNDMIVSVNGRELNGESVSEVVSWIRGEPGTTVDVGFYRPSTKEYLNYTIERATIDNYTVSYRMQENNIGYIEVTDFYETTASEFQKAIDELQAQGMTSLIIDLRNNPGGYVKTAVDMCDRIVSSGKIVYTEDKNGNILEQYNATPEYSLDIPIVLLVNENSASASEIFAGCLKDHGKATLVGKKTFGKGIVQNVFQLDDGSAVKLTIAKYYTPNGNDIHKIGIEPDVEVDLPEEVKTMSVVPEEQDTQLQKAIEILKQQ